MSYLVSGYLDAVTYFVERTVSVSIESNSSGASYQHLAALNHSNLRYSLFQNQP